jgi:hypothetical protein
MSDADMEKAGEAGGGHPEGGEARTGSEGSATVTRVELMIMSGPDDGTLLTLAAPHNPDGYLIGRREDCDVVLPYDSQISRNHARLYRVNGDWHVQDLGSKNGTYVGKQRIETSPLVVGQMFRMGRTWLRLQAWHGLGSEPGNER